MKLLNERVAVITGSTKGNGRAIANLYSEQGANVVVTGRSPSELKIHAGSVGFQPICFNSYSVIPTLHAN